MWGVGGGGGKYGLWQDSFPSLLSAIKAQIQSKKKSFHLGCNLERRIRTIPEAPDYGLEQCGAIVRLAVLSLTLWGFINNEFRLSIPCKTAQVCGTDAAPGCVDGFCMQVSGLGRTTIVPVDVDLCGVKAVDT